MALLNSLLALRKDPRTQKLPPVLSALCVLIGVIYFLLLPLDDYSRKTYISENALLPGQVHTYFSGSEQAIFNAYRNEVRALVDKPQEEVSNGLGLILRSSGLKVATQKYGYEAGGQRYNGENVYAVLHAPRGDATEAIVLVAAWTNMQGQSNVHGVALALTLARYFKRWSLWSKDIIFLIPSESRAGPQAWVEAYHDDHDPTHVQALPLKSGALEGAIVVDNPLDHRFEKLYISYDGINGLLPNLDLFNTAVQVSKGQHGIDSVLQNMWSHSGSYKDRLQTMLRSIASQGLGQASGPHSCFIPYHVDAITLRAIGHGWQDDMAMGRVVESLFRSLNNLMEHFHQSFFLYLLMDTRRFVSIGTYLPSAMLVAANFSIMAIALWMISGRMAPPSANNKKPSEQPVKQDSEDSQKFETFEKNGVVAVIPKEDLLIRERQLFYPAALVLSLHFLGVIPLYIFNNTPKELLTVVFSIFTITNIILPSLLRSIINIYLPLLPQQKILTKCFSLLMLGIFLATLATINFSLAFVIGLLSTPLTFTGQSAIPQKDLQATSISFTHRVFQNAVLQIFSPPIIVSLACTISAIPVHSFLMEAVFAWRVWGVWTHVIVWCVWWPAWLAGATDVAPAATAAT